VSSTATVFLLIFFNILTKLGHILSHINQRYKISKRRGVDALEMCPLSLLGANIWHAIAEGTDLNHVDKPVQMKLYYGFFYRNS
jgi:hypothetical protein